MVNFICMIITSRNRVLTTIKDVLSQITEYHKIVVDIGCGDGKFIYNLAKKHPEDFYIGIDASNKLLTKTAAKLHKKPVKGGVDNLIFLVSEITSVPEELQNIASEIYINFPWGSLLEGLINVEIETIKKIVNIGKQDAKLHIFFSYDEKFEANFVQERNLPALSRSYLETEWKSKIEDFGISVETIEELDADEKQNIHTSWGKELLDTRDRVVFKITGIINKWKKNTQ